MVYLDVETSPVLAYTWSLKNANIGIGQIVEPSRLLCVSYAIDDGPIRFLAEWQKGGPEVMVHQMWEVLDEQPLVCAYNVTFDTGHLNREFAQAQLPPPATYQMVDPWQAAKRMRFASSKLDQVLTELGLPNKVQHSGFSLWKDVLAGKRSARAEMKKYNIADVDRLRQVYKRLLPWFPSHPNVALMDGRPDGCIYCGSMKVESKGWAYTATGKYQRYRCSSCRANLRDTHSVATTEYRRV